MNKIIVSSGLVFNCDNQDDIDRMLELGAHELSPQEIAAAGMTGYEHLVSPVNTEVTDDGSIIFTPPEPEPLESVKARKLAEIDSQTSAAILAGFDYTVNGENLHFSYDSFDQQNFADTANACLLAQSGVAGPPESVTWNAYRGETRELVRLTLTATQFLELYTAGALAHKAAKLAWGGERKAAVQATQTREI